MSGPRSAAAERAAVLHHRSTRDPGGLFGREFVRDASAAIEGIRARGRLPLVVGGTMLYAKALREGLGPAAADPQLRARPRRRSP
jgi:tRNA dimethylallyltransferase